MGQSVQSFDEAIEILKTPRPASGGSDLLTPLFRGVAEGVLGVDSEGAQALQTLAEQKVSDVRDYVERHPFRVIGGATIAGLIVGLWHASRSGGRR